MLLTLIAAGTAVAEAPPLPYPSTPDAPPPVLAAPEAPQPEADAASSPVAATPPTDGVAQEVDATLSQPEPPPVQWYYPSYWFGPAPWDSAVELGLNGSSGTSDSLSTRSGGYLKRETEWRKVDVSLYHNRTKAAGEETQNNAMLDARHDWLFGKSPWSVFSMTQVFYDRFQEFDLNVNADAGLGYNWLDTKLNKLTTRLGAGATREFGGVDDKWRPEGQAGVSYELNCACGRKFYARSDYFPQWEDFSTYRVVTDLGMEIELYDPSNMSLKFSATDRYDSEPGQAKPHNTNYSVLLLWKL